MATSPAFALPPLLAAPRPPRRLIRMAQPALFCACGQGTPAVAGLCRVCYRAAAHSRAAFAGNRETVLARDGRSCRVCGAGKSVHVHHRRPGVHDPAWLIALCPGCHARVHRTVRFRVWLPEFLVILWAEQHPHSPLQLQFPLGPAGREGKP